jgi:four helix bundle protein
MKYERFEDLPVWKAAQDLGVRILILAEDGALRGKGDLPDQIQRAAISISNNIAEGFERGSTAELLAFLYYARGSAGEVRSMLHLMDRLPAFSNLRSEISDLKSLAESCSRQIRGWADSLQNSEIKGPRHLTDSVRAAWDHKASARAFLEELGRIRTARDEAIEADRIG